MFVSKNGYTIG